MKNYYILNKSVCGVKNPLMLVNIIIRQKFDRIEVMENDKSISFNMKKVGLSSYEIKANLTNNSNVKVNIIIGNKVIEICLIKNRKIKRVFNKVYTVLFGNKVGRILLKIKKIIKYFWREYHFLVPFKFWPFYTRMVSDKLFNKHYNPFKQNDYIKWYKSNIDENLKNDNVEFDYNPLISILIPTYNIDKKYLSECLDSILNQTYTNFEICIADDHSTKQETIDTLHEYENKDSRVRVVYRKENGHISNATNSAYALANGEYIGLMDNDDLITPNALYEMVKCLNDDKTIDMIYSDEDKMDMSGNLCEPHFKPDWSPNSFLGGNYLCHFVIMKKSILDEIGGEKSEFNGAQDFDYFLRFVEKAKNIKHIPSIMYHWRKIPGSTADTVDNKDYAIENGRKAVEDALKRRNLDGEVVLPMHTTQYIVKYKHSNPLLSIIINIDNYKTVDLCINSIEKNNYINYEIILIDRFSKLKKIKDKNIRVIKSLNFEKYCNGTVYLFLDSSIAFDSEDAISNMIGYAIQKNIGAVGTKMVYKNDIIDNAGLFLCNDNCLKGAFCNFNRDNVGFYGRLLVAYDYSIVPLDCLMIEKSKYEKISINSNLDFYGKNIDICYSLLENKLNNVILPFVETITYRKYSNKRIISKREFNYLNKKYNLDDKFYNKNLSKYMPFYLDRKKK